MTGPARSAAFERGRPSACPPRPMYSLPSIAALPQSGSRTNSANRQNNCPLPPRRARACPVVVPPTSNAPGKTGSRLCTTRPSAPPNSWAAAPSFAPSSSRHHGLPSDTGVNQGCGRSSSRGAASRRQGRGIFAAAHPGAPQRHRQRIPHRSTRGRAVGGGQPRLRRASERPGRGSVVADVRGAGRSRSRPSLTAYWGCPDHRLDRPHRGVSAHSVFPAASSSSRSSQSCRTRGRSCCMRRGANERAGTFAKDIPAPEFCPDASGWPIVACEVAGGTRRARRPRQTRVSDQRPHLGVAADQQGRIPRRDPHLPDPGHRGDRR